MDNSEKIRYDLKNNTGRNRLKNVLLSRMDNIKNLGYKYENNIFKNTMSPSLFVEAKRNFILDKLEKMVFELIEDVKTIKISMNYTLPKRYKKIN